MPRVCKPGGREGAHLVDQVALPDGVAGAVPPRDSNAAWWAPSGHRLQYTGLTRAPVIPRLTPWGPRTHLPARPPALCEMILMEGGAWAWGPANQWRGMRRDIRALLIIELSGRRLKAVGHDLLGFGTPPRGGWPFLPPGVPSGTTQGQPGDTHP